MNTSKNERASGTAGSLQLQIFYIGDSADEVGGFRCQYSYEIKDANSPGAPLIGTDLYSGVGAPVDADAALATLVSFVSAAGEAYGHMMRGGHSENGHLFRRGIAESAYMNSDELQVLAMDLEHRATRSRQVGTRSTPRPEPPSL